MSEDDLDPPKDSRSLEPSLSSPSTGAASDDAPPGAAAGDPPGPARPAKGAYRVPPLHTRFRPGQSGNPRGRPKHSQNRRTIAREVLLEPVPIIENGKRKTISTLKALYLTLRGAALKKGDLRAALALIQAADEAGLTEEGGAVGSACLTPDEEEVLETLLGRLGVVDDDGAPS